MNRTFLIARQEFIKYVTRRGFLISILMFPMWIAVVILVPQWTGGGGSHTVPQSLFTVVDESGGSYGDAIRAALAREYARGHRPDFAYVAPPASLQRAAPGGFAAVARAYLGSDMPVVVGKRRSTHLDTVILIPPAFGEAGQATAHMFTRGAADPGLHDFVADILSGVLQRNALKRLAPALVNSDVLNAAATLDSRDVSPTKNAARDDSYDSLVPMALAIVLFIVSVMNASVLLQGVVEEKSTRMIEVLLSCATPREITSGKLIGVIAVALTTIAIWALALFGLMTLASSGTVTLVLGALSAVSPSTLPFLLLFFFCGLLIYGSIFLAIGSMANSLADAQSLLGPTMLILILPNLMISGIMADPNGTLASTVSWIPFYTPFFMMLRIASHPPAVQLWGTSALALATTILLIWWTGRVFANHVLTTERPPTVAKLFAGLLRRRG